MTLSLHLLTHIHSKHVAALWEVANKTDVDDFLHDWFSSICHGCEWEGTLQYSTITLSASHILVLSVLQTGSYVLHVESLFWQSGEMQPILCARTCLHTQSVFVPLEFLMHCIGRFQQRGSPNCCPNITFCPRQHIVYLMPHKSPRAGEAFCDHWTTATTTLWGWM